MNNGRRVYPESLIIAMKHFGAIALSRVTGIVDHLNLPL